MDNLVWIIYLIGLIEGVKGFFCVVLLINVISVIVYGVRCDYPLRSHNDTSVEYHVAFQQRKDAFRCNLKRSLAIFCASLLLLIMVPSKSTSYQMLAAYGAYEVAQTEPAQRLAPKTLELLELTMDKQIKTLKEEK